MYEQFTDRARKAMQAANQEALRFNHEYIGTEHILLGLIHEGSGVAANVLKNLDVDLRKVREEVEKIVQSGPEPVTLDKLPLTPRAKSALELAIKEAHQLNHNYVGTEHLLLGLIREQEGIAAQVFINLGLKLADVREEVLNLLGHPPQSEPRLDEPGKTKTPALDAHGRDLTALARQGMPPPEIDPGDAIEQVLRILGCRHANNALLVGEPGLGMTAIVEGVARRIAANHCLPALAGRRLVAINLTGLILQRERFSLMEDYVRAILNEARRANVLLFLEGFSAFLVANGAPDVHLVSHLLRSALLSEQFQCIGAVTPDKYQTAIAGDEVFGLHFQPVMVAPPSERDAVEALRAMRDRLEAHHRVQIRDEAIGAAVVHANTREGRWPLTGAMQLLDQACVHLCQKCMTQPPDLKELEAQIEQLNHEKEMAIAEQDFDRAAQRRDQADKLKKQKAKLIHDWRAQSREIIGVVDAQLVEAVGRKLAGRLVDRE